MTRYEIVAECEPPSVAIARPAGGEHRILVARQAFACGEVVLHVAGVESTTTHRYALQVSASCHVQGREPLVDARGRDRYPWRFLNHACEPNLALRERELVARRAIAAGDELSLNYLASEYDMAEPFACACDHGCALIEPGPDGARWIRGYRYLSEDQRARLDGYACPHLSARCRGARSATPSG